MTVTTTQRFLVSCIRRQRLPLLAIILYGIVTYFLWDHLWYVFSHVRSRNVSLQVPSGETPSRKLMYLQVLFRHGHHAPFSLYTNDPISESYWMEGLGQLTKLGRLQHYVVGKYLRQRYEGFLGYNVQEVDCMASIAYRSTYAAYAFLAGFYPAPPGKRMADDIPFQPIPCSFTPMKDDKWLQSLPNCLASELEKSIVFKSEEAEEFMIRYQDFYDYWTGHSGMDVNSYADAGSLYKILLAEKTENLTIPTWAEITWREFEENVNICYHFNFRTRLLHRLRAGPVIEEIVQKMRQKIENPNSKSKVYVYSGHGSNLAAVLNALQVFNHRIPTYASAIIFELYQEVDGGNTVRLLFSNATEPEKHIPPPHVLQLPGCDEFCPLEELERQTADLYPLDWERECHQIDQSRLMKIIQT